MKKINFFLVLISIFISLFIFEVLFRYLEMDKHVVYYSSNYYGYNKKPNQTIERKNKTIITDNLGNRNSPNNTIENTNLFFLGDSITFGGSAVNNDETFSHIFAKNWNENFLNISNNGWGLQNIINYVDYHNLYKENSTYILTCISDCFTRNLRRYEQYFFFNKNYFLGLVNYFKFFIFKINQKLKAEHDDEKTELQKKKDNIKTMKISVNLLKDFQEKLESINSRLIVVFSPNSNYIKSLISGNNSIEDYTRLELFESFYENRINFIDMIKLFDDKQLTLFKKFYIDHVHLSKEGHKLYADLMNKEIDE